MVAPVTARSSSFAIGDTRVPIASALVRFEATDVVVGPLPGVEFTDDAPAVGVPIGVVVAHAPFLKDIVAGYAVPCGAVGAALQSEFAPLDGE